MKFYFCKAPGYIFPLCHPLYYFFPFSWSSSTMKAGQEAWFPGFKEAAEPRRIKPCCGDAIDRNTWALTKLDEYTRSHARTWRWKLMLTHRLGLLFLTSAQLTSSLPSGLCSRVTSSRRLSLTTLSPLPSPSFPCTPVSPLCFDLHSKYPNQRRTGSPLMLSRRLLSALLDFTRPTFQVFITLNVWNTRRAWNFCVPPRALLCWGHTSQGALSLPSPSLTSCWVVFWVSVSKQT